MQDFDDEELKEIHMGRLIQVLSHQMKRKNYVISMINDDGLTTMQKHVLKFLLLETLHKVVYQKDIEEECCSFSKKMALLCGKAKKKMPV